MSVGGTLGRGSGGGRPRQSVEPDLEPDELRDPPAGIGERVAQLP
ncbi:hypothetical protein [Rhodococcus triatomae]